MCHLSLAREGWLFRLCRYLCHMPDFDESLDQLIRLALREDLGDGDHSTLCCIPAGEKGKARLLIKQDCTLAGVAVAEKILRYVHPAIGFTAFKTDGEKVQRGDVAFETEAPVHTLLACERLLLNCMQRMSGIATLTSRYTEKLAGFHTRILDTRKTTPNFRLLEKEAVRIGGGSNHRMGLYDMIMLKDNHIDYCGGIRLALERAKRYVLDTQPDLKIEVETRTLSDVKEAVNTGIPDRIMLDNFSPADVSAALEIINGRSETEASGGVSLANLLDYAQTGVDFISAGALIHQAQSIDLSFKAVAA